MTVNDHFVLYFLYFLQLSHVYFKILKIPSEKSRHCIKRMSMISEVYLHFLLWKINKVLVKQYYSKRINKLRRFTNTLQIYQASSLIKMLQIDSCPGIQPKTLEDKIVLRIENTRDSIWFETTQQYLQKKECC